MIDYSKIANELIIGDLTETRYSINRSQIEEFLHNTLKIIFPILEGDRRGDLSSVTAKLQEIANLLNGIIATGLQLPTSITPEHLTDQFLNSLPEIQRLLRLDAEALCAGDPAATSVEEVLLAYPGFFATATYRIANRFYQSGVKLFPRILTEYAHQLTGIDIHPGAKIGRSFFIDHGTGVVIGETTEIGDHVKVYQGVTLGALSVEKSLSTSKRHPTIEDHVVIYSNATILGGKTTVGHNSVIGGNVWLTESVAPYSTVYHQSEVKVRELKTPQKDGR